jgi:hypothetical protein
MKLSEELDRKTLITNLGGPANVAALSPEARADAMEEVLQNELNRVSAGKSRYPTVAELEKQVASRPFRRGVGNSFHSVSGNVQRLPPMPAAPTLLDFFRLRFATTANHCLQSAHLALKNGESEEVILACLLHDTAQELMKADHAWWSAQLYEPYVSEKVTFAIRYHQVLRFYPDEAAGYAYPALYRTLFGEDYKPEPYIENAYRMLKDHAWYHLPRAVTVNDLYAFDPASHVSIDPFVDIVGRHFKQPKEGLGFDNSPVAHMWRTIITPDRPL